MSLDSAKCTHIVGGELFYDCMGNNTYHITLKLYRDCHCTNCAQYGNPEYVTVFDSSGNVYTQLAMPLPPVIQIPLTYINPCISPPDVCLQEADYSGDVVLPPTQGGYTIVYQRCCRAIGVINLDPNQGATFTVNVPGSALASCNNSARFNNAPPVYVCVNTPLSISYGATDPDGDSLVYSLCETHLQILTI
jgi:hypothetical protein